MKVEVAVLGFPILIVLTVSVDVKQHCTELKRTISSELRNCVKVEVVVLGSPSVPNNPYDLCGRKAAG